MSKKLMVFFFCILFSSIVLAQDSERSMAISISPVSLLLTSVDLLFQYNINSFLTLTLPAQFAYYWPAAITLDWAGKRTEKFEITDLPVSASGGIGARLYPTFKGMTSGFYLEPRMTINYFQIGATNKALGGPLSIKNSAVIAMLRFGWDSFSDSGFYSSIGAGIGYGYNFSTKIQIPLDYSESAKTLSYILSTSTDEQVKSFLSWALDFKLGFAW